jgi:hypothetical protein
VTTATVAHPDSEIGCREPALAMHYVLSLEHVNRWSWILKEMPMIRYVRGLGIVAATVLGTAAAVGVGPTYASTAVAESGEYLYSTALAENQETEGPKNPPIRGFALVLDVNSDADRRIIVY